MALPETIAAYEDCENYFEQAHATEKGIRVLFPTHQAAGLFRMRMNQFRVLDRREAKRLYDPTDPRWGKSQYDKYCVSVKPTAEDDGQYWVYINPWKAEAIEVEEL